MTRRWAGDRGSGALCVGSALWAFVAHPYFDVSVGVVGAVEGGPSPEDVGDVAELVK